MSRDQYIKILESQLRRLNEVIDYKIMNRESYSKEARQHRELLIRIKKHSPSTRSFNKIASVFYYA